MMTRIAEGRRIVRGYTGWAAGSGLIPLPLVDVAAVMATQIAMIRRLARLYAVPFERDRARAVAMSAMGGLLPQGVAVAGVPSALKFVPVVGTLLGFAVMPAAAVAVTVALGDAFIRHFERGGVLRDADPGTILGSASTSKQAAADPPVAQVADTAPPAPPTQDTAPASLAQNTTPVAAEIPSAKPPVAKLPIADSPVADPPKQRVAPPPPERVAPKTHDIAKPAAAAPRAGRIKRHRRPRAGG